MASDFHEVRFPLDVGLGSRGGLGGAPTSSRSPPGASTATRPRPLPAALRRRARRAHTLDALHAVIVSSRSGAGGSTVSASATALIGSAALHHLHPRRATSASARATAPRRRSRSSTPTATRTRLMRGPSLSRSPARARRRGRRGAANRAGLLLRRDDSDMRMSPARPAVLADREGRRLKGYRDSVGIWTIGTGHTSAAEPPEVTPGLTIAEAECDAIFARDLTSYEKAVARAVKVPLARTSSMRSSASATTSDPRASRDQARFAC